MVGFGLANDEAAFPPEPFAPAFAIAREAGLLPVPHAGELAGPESVRGALDALHARRLGHGVRAVEDPDLVARLAREQVCLDVCPTSNLLLAVVADLAEHPLPRLLRAGVPCSINADDPLLFGSGLLEEYTVARDGMGLDDGQLAVVAASSIRHSGAPSERRAAALAGIDAWLAVPDLALAAPPAVGARRRGAGGDDRAATAGCGGARTSHRGTAGGGCAVYRRRPAR